MKMRFINTVLTTILLLVLLSGCFSERITVIGIAEDDKASATVVNKEGQYYVLKGIYRWDEKFIGKLVKVTGKLFIAKYIVDTLRHPLYWQEKKSDTYFLQNPKWKLLKKRR
jgi:hypothetical protein